MSWGLHEITVPFEPDQVELRVRVDQDGHIYRDFSLQLVVNVDGKYNPVVRYDCSHGTEPHRDILNWDGSTRTKTAMRRGIMRKQAFEEAFAELTTNWKRYVEDYLRRRP